MLALDVRPCVDRPARKTGRARKRTAAPRDSAALTPSDFAARSVATALDGELEAEGVAASKPVRVARGEYRIDVAGEAPIVVCGWSDYSGEECV